MFKKLVLLLGLGIASLCFALTPVDVNKADQAALDGVKGIGPATSKAILDERKRTGPFKDWNDFSARVKGIGDKRAANLSKAGLTVNGQAKANAGVPATAGGKNDAKVAQAEAKASDSKHAHPSVKK
ncbi:competence protein ComEA [Paucimonas lemoignei]|uniref:Competence protein ComEA n=1 Tax=Paucimonas lemoignei TaxID=29443 RepID=A0A4V2UIK4_PAULE|nr:helix-hairpin-helix domain-containing protein [Paucimonas lemoignei]TCS36520.1 competence protein ComEA [Paucimonas lemoignei]